MKRDKERLINKHDELAQALKKITYGFYVVSSKGNSVSGSRPAGSAYAAGLVSWITQCSFDPPMVMLALQKQSHLSETILSSKAFVINILGKADKPMISPFSKDTQVEQDRLNGYAFEEGIGGAPILKAVPAYIECQLEETIENSADHYILIGKVVGQGVANPDAEPLTEWETDYHYGG